MPCHCTAELNESRANDKQTNGDSKPGDGDPKQGNGEIALTVRELVDVPPEAEAPVLEQQDREAFAEAGVLEKSRSLQPGDRLPPQPLVKTLEEVADKLGKPLAIPPSPIYKCPSKVTTAAQDLCSCQTNWVSQ